MAKKSTISGLTVTIGADTKQFTDAVKEIDKDLRNVAKDLKSVSSSLKIDSGDAESYADKMKLLREAAEKATAKVELYKKGIEALNKQYKEGKVSPEDYQKSLAKLERELESATYEQNLAINALDEYQRATSATTKEIDKLGDEQKETNKEVENFDDATKNASTGAKTLGQSIKDFLTSDAVKKGLQKVVNLAKDIGKHLVEAAKKVFEFSKGSVELAGNWNDAVETSKRAFAEFADDAVEFAESQGRIYGIYSGDMLVAMNNLGLMFSAMDIGRDKALDMSERVMRLAGDLRAAFGGDINQILEALNSSFGSTTRTLRQFGIFTSEAEIKAYALETGIVKVTVDELKLQDAIVKVKEATQKQTEALTKYGEESVEYERATVNLQKAEAKLDEVTEGKVDKLTSAERATAILALSEERLADIQNQAIAESDKYPALVNRTKAAFEELRKEIGIRLLPVFEDFLKKFLNFLDSEKGQEIVNAIADAFEKLGKKVSELLDDGTLQDLISGLIENLPKVISDIGDFIGKIVELAPEIFDLTEKLLALFGIKTDAYEAKEAFVAVQDELVLLANQYQISTDDAQKAIETFAAQNGIYVSQIYKDWEAWEPQINAWMENLSTDTTTMTEQITTEYEKIPEELQNEVNDIKDTDLSGWDEFAIKYTTKIAEFATVMANAWNLYCQPVVDWIQEKISWVGGKFENIFGTDWETDSSLSDQSTPDWMYGSGAWSDPFRASGGAVKAGRLYRVNDDAGRRTEWFIPNQNGIILNGNQTDRITNNNNSSNFSGGINIYVNSYGTNVAEVADELGEAFYNKVRMIGAMI